jgi:hypothetical protein
MWRYPCQSPLKLVTIMKQKPKTDKARMPSQLRFSKIRGATKEFPIIKAPAVRKAVFIAGKSNLFFISATGCKATLPSAEAPRRSAAVKATVQLMGEPCPQARQGPRSCAKGPLLRERRGSVSALAMTPNHHHGRVPKAEQGGNDKGDPPSGAARQGNPAEPCGINQRANPLAKLAHHLPKSPQI